MRRARVSFGLTGRVAREYYRTRGYPLTSLLPCVAMKNGYLRVMLTKNVNVFPKNTCQESQKWKFCIRNNNFKVFKELYTLFSTKVKSIFRAHASIF